MSSTGLAFPFFAVTAGVTALFGAVSLVLLVTRGRVSRLALLGWGAFPLAVTALSVLFLADQSPTNPLFRLRFHLSRPALEDATRDALSSNAPPTPTWVGLFPVRRIDVAPPDVRFMSDGCGVIDECGLAYVPGPIPARRSKTRLRHLGGPWYHLYSVF